MDIQARITPALMAIHNIIREYDSDEITAFLDDTVEDVESGEHTGDFAEGPA